MNPPQKGDIIEMTSPMCTAIGVVCKRWKGENGDDVDGFGVRWVSKAIGYTYNHKDCDCNFYDTGEVVGMSNTTSKVIGHIDEGSADAV